MYTLLFLLAIASATQVGIATAQTNTPPPGLASHTPFDQPTDDGKTAAAVILPGPNDTAWLCWTTPAGPIVTAQIVTRAWPPPPTPPPPTPPAPPKPTPANLIIVTDGPATGRTWSTAPVTTALAKRSIKTSEYTIQQVADQTTPPEALRWIGRTAGQTLPHCFLASATDQILWRGPPPATDTAWLALLQNPPAKPPPPRPTKPQTLDRTSQPVPCTGPNCPAPFLPGARRR